MRTSTKLILEALSKCIDNKDIDGEEFYADLLQKEIDKDREETD